MLLLYVGAISAEADVSDQSADLLVTTVGLVLLAAVLATLSGLVSALTLRRGLAVGAVVIALLVSTGFVAAVQSIATVEGNDTVAQWAGLLSPFTLVDGVQAGCWAAPRPTPRVLRRRGPTPSTWRPRCW